MNLKLKSGFSLVELMVAMLILAVLVLGSAAILYQAGGTIAIQNNKRAAVSAASRRLEQISGMLYDDIRSNSGGLYYIDASNDRQSSPPDDTVSINGRQQPIIVSAETIFVPSPDREFVQVEAKVQYRSGGNWVVLTTNIR